MPEFLATAFVQIKPQVRGFKTELQKQVKAAIGIDPIPIPIRPAGLDRFRQIVKAETSIQPIEVPVIPDTKGFRELLLAKIETAKRGIKVAVPVDVAGAAIAQRQVGLVVNELGNIVDATQAASRSTKEKSGADKAALTQEQARVQINNRLKLAEESLLQARREGLSVEQQELFLDQASVAARNSVREATALLAVERSRENQQLLAGATAKSEDIQALKTQISARIALVDVQKTVTAALQQEVRGVATSVEARAAAIRIERGGGGF